MGGWFLRRGARAERLERDRPPLLRLRARPGRGGDGGGGGGGVRRAHAARARVRAAAGGGPDADARWSRSCSLRREHDYLQWLWPILVGSSAAASIAVTVVAPASRGVCDRRRPRRGAALSPAIYSATVWQVPVDGTFPVAGPYIQDNLDVYGIPPDDVDSYRHAARLRAAARAGRRWDVLTQGSNTAAPLFTLLGGRAARARRLRHDRPGARARRRSRR